VVCSDYARMTLLIVTNLGNTTVAEVEEMTEIESTKPNRMARRRQETRGKLLAATHDLVVEKGIEKTTMSDITETADLGRRTFYYHFASKDECITATVAEVYQRHAIHVIKLVSPSDDPALIIATSIQSVMRSLIHEPITACLAQYPMLLADALFAALGKFVKRDVQAGIDIGRFKPPVREKIIDSMMMWTLVGLIIDATDVKPDITAVLQEYAQMFLMIQGIAADEAREIAILAGNNLLSAKEKE